MRGRSISYFLVFAFLAILLLGVFSFVPSKAYRGYVTFYSFSFEKNAWSTLTWPYFMRPDYYNVVKKPGSDWSSGLYVYADWNRSFAFMFYHRDTSVCSSGSCNVSRSYYDKYRADESSYAYSGSLGYDQGSGAQGSASATCDNAYCTVYYAHRYPLVPNSPVHLWRAYRKEDGSRGDACSDGYYTGWVVIDGLSTTPEVIGYTKDLGDVRFAGFGYDSVRSSYFIVGKIADSCYTSGSDFVDGLYYSYGDGESRVSSDYTCFAGPCGLAVCKDPSDNYILVTGFENGVPRGVSIPQSLAYARSNSFWYYDAFSKSFYCMVSSGYAIRWPSYVVKRIKPLSVALSTFYGSSASLDYNSTIYAYVTNSSRAGSDFYYFKDTDGDGVPDFYRLGYYYVYRFELSPVVPLAIEFNGPASISHDTNYGILSFRLYYREWPGARYTLENFSVSVDGTDLNTSGKDLSSWFEYNFSVGEHQICYSFGIKDGSDSDSYNNCYTVHVGYIPWDVNIHYRQDGSTLYLIAFARDDGKIVRYEWNVDGNVYQTPSPILKLSSLKLGEHNVCLTVVDDDNTPVTVCGSFKYSTAVVHPVVYKVIPKKVVLPERTITGRLSVGFIPSTPVVLTAIGALVVILWLVL